MHHETQFPADAPAQTQGQGRAGQHQGARAGHFEAHQGAPLAVRLGPLEGGGGDGKAAQVFHRQVDALFLLVDGDVLQEIN